MADDTNGQQQPQARRPSLLERVTRSNAANVNFVRALLHGDSGIGKTTSIRTLPSQTTLVAVSERGVIPLRNDAYPVFPLESWEDVQSLYVAFRAGPVVIDGHQIKTLVVDSLSALSEMCKHKIVTVDRPALKEERKSMRKDKPLGVYDDLMVMEDWGLYQRRMKDLLAAMCALPVNVIFTSLSAWTEDKQTGAQWRTPDLNGRLAQECPAHFDLVLHMQSVKDAEGKQVRIWQTHNDGKIVAKDASGALDSYEDPDWTRVFMKILRGNGNGANAAKSNNSKAAPAASGAKEK